MKRGAQWNKKKKGKKLFLAIINAPYHGYIILPLDNYNGETCLYCFNESNKQLDPHGHVELLGLGKYISNDSSLFLSLTKILNYRGARVIRFKIIGRNEADFRLERRQLTENRDLHVAFIYLLTIKFVVSILRHRRELHRLE